MIKNIIYTLLLFVFFIIWISCEKEGSTVLNPNQPPETWIANVPPENTIETSYFPLLSLSWKGGDTDGYIKGFYIRWNTYHLIKGDSIIREFQYTTSYDSTIAFESSDDVNLQVLEVKAIDNNYVSDPTPAVRKFYTTKVEEPQTTIKNPVENGEYFILPNITDYWHGIPLAFHGSDTDGEVRLFSFKVDDTPWSEWTEDTTVYITPGYFKTPLSGEHKIMVKAKDNTDVEDSTPAEVNFLLFEVSFDKSILVLDETFNGRGTILSPSDEMVDSFYINIIDRDFDGWDYTIDNGVPSKEILGQYRLVIWHSDDKDDNKFYQYQDYLADYLSVGGKLFICGWDILKKIAPEFPYNFERDDFAYEYLHIACCDQQIISVAQPADFIGGFGQKGFPDVNVDSVRVARNFKGKIPYVNLLTTATFAEPILTYNSFEDRPGIEGETCALSYYNNLTRIIFLAFPMYYIKQEEANSFMDKALEFLQE